MSALASGVLGCNGLLNDGLGKDAPSGSTGDSAPLLGVVQAALSAPRGAPELSPVPVEAHFTPAVLDSRPVSLILQLDRDPVSVARANAGGALGAAEEAALRAAITEDQAALRARIEALGGKVRQSFQNVYNGLSVTLPRAALPALRERGSRVRLHAARKIQRALSYSVPFLAAPEVWRLGAHGLRGEGVKVAVIDSGIDYTHADFGGPGTVQAYALARESDTSPADPRHFGPSAPRIKGGVDLVGDDYDADSDDPARIVPQPDPNPLDCEGHGTHVTGIVGGSGVNLDGSKFDGPYDRDTFTREFTIAPGVAPRADLYSIRVFGCEGSVDNDVLIQAIEWAVENDIDVINMSLGSPFGDIESPDVVAAKNAIAAGVTIVASAGNSGDVPYITGSPGAGDGIVSVAAMDVIPTFPGATLTTEGGAIEVINANRAGIADGTEYPVVVLGSPGAVGLGCTPEEYGPEVAGALVVTQRGSCDRIARASLGQEAGAAAVAMINTEAGLPPLEGEIEGVSIPFFGVRPEDAAVLTSAASASASPREIANPGFRRVASFSSSGPRFGDSGLKPSVIAPGVSIVSAGVGTGTSPLISSGTSMAAPAVAGLAALARQAHPEWSAAQVAAALTSTADPALLDGYVASRAGTGVPQATSATRAQLTVTASADGASSLNFGYIELRQPFSGERSASVYNGSSAAIRFALSAPPALSGGAPHAVSVPATLSVEPGETASFALDLDVPVSSDADPLGFSDVSGMVVLTPSSESAGVGPLRIPYYGVVRPASALSATVELPSAEAPTGSVTLANADSSVAGTAEFFDLGIQGEQSPAGCNDIRAVGVQSVPASGDRLLVFAINGYRRCSNAAANEYDLLITNEAGAVYPVIGVDSGLVNVGAYSGQLATLTIDPATGEQTLLPALAPTDSSNVFLFTLASLVGVSADQPRFSYTIEAISGLTLESDIPTDTGSFNAFTSALIGVGNAIRVLPGTSAQLSIGLDPEEFALFPSKGLLITTAENAEAIGQAALFPFAPAAPPPPSLNSRLDQTRRLRTDLASNFRALPVRTPPFFSR